MKLDYRSWDLIDKVPNLLSSFKKFANAVTVKDLEGWVSKSDRFCKAVFDQDDELLDELILDLL